jgi:hypothetical protein
VSRAPGTFAIRCGVTPGRSGRAGDVCHPARHNTRPADFDDERGCISAIVGGDAAPVTEANRIRQPARLTARV